MEVLSQLGNELTEEMIEILGSVNPDAPAAVTASILTYRFIGFCDENSVSGVVNSNLVPNIAEVLFTGNPNESVINGDVSVLVNSLRDNLSNQGKLDQFVSYYNSEP